MKLLAQLSLCLLDFLIGWTWLLLGKHQHLEGKIGDPLLAEAQLLVELTKLHDGLHNTGVVEVIFVEDIVDGFLSHGVERLLHETWQTEFELHQVAQKHHEILGEGLELDEINIDILQLVTLLANALVNLLEEIVIGIIDTLHHLLDMRLLAQAQLVVLGRNAECSLEGTKVGQHCQIGDAQL
mgnify:FL=1